MDKGKKGGESKDGKEILKLVNQIEEEMAKVVIGQKEIIRRVIGAVLCNGHVLLEGVPGIAKTLVVKAMAKVMGCDVKRVQFTVDLLPTDITGIMSYSPEKGFAVVKGPIFTHFLLADEINRSPPKTQSALLEAMQEGAVSIAKETYALPKPFFVMATENPIEVSGVYSLPEAQMDRFLFKLIMTYPTTKEEIAILTTNVSLKDFEDFDLKKVLSPSKIIDLQKKTKEVFSSDEIKNYIVKIVEETRGKDFDYSKYISYGASPRAAISIYIASKAEALINGRNYVLPKDVRAVACPVMMHRIVLNYEAEADKITSEMIVEKILDKVKAP